MTDDHRARDAERSQQRVRVPGELLETVLIMFRLARFAEADLIRGDHAIARIAQDLDRLLPGGRAKILAMQQDGGLAVRRGRFHVHIGHVEVGALRGEAEMRDGPRVVESLQFRPVARKAVERRRMRQRRPGQRAAENISKPSGFFNEPLTLARPAPTLEGSAPGLRANVAALAELVLREGLPKLNFRFPCSPGPRRRPQQTIRQRPITTKAIGSAATYPSLRGALRRSNPGAAARRQRPDGRAAAPGLLTWGFSGQGLISVFHVLGF